MKLRTVLAAASCLVMPVLAHAQPVTGPYVNLGGGATILNPVNYSFHNPAYGFRRTGSTGKLLWQVGYTVMGGIGYGFGDGFRVEVDGDWLHNNIHKANGSLGQSRLSGQEQDFGGFVNAFYDVSVGLPIFPYIGGGVGYQYIDFDSKVGAGSTYISRKEGSFGYDVIAGVAYPIAAVPGLSVTAQYRFMQLTQHQNHLVLNPLGNGVINIGQESTHSFLFGLRYQIFNPPPPPPAVAAAAAPVAAPAPAPAKTYLVFFDWDKYNLTPRALNIIAQAASDSKTAGTTTIDVSGYTDTSGTPVYNQGLSERRAKAVAAQLVADGVLASEIETHAFGETHLLVPTGPGVREPQNRRVEIVLN